MKCPIHGSIHSIPLCFRSLLRNCCRQSSLVTGKKIHAFLITSGIASFPNFFLRNALLHLYASCGHFHDTYKVFDEIPSAYKDAADLTALMGCFARYGMFKNSLNSFVDFRRECMKLDDVAIAFTFGACAKLGDLGFGLQIHGCMIKMGFGSILKTGNAVMDMYVKCGLLSEARRVFEEMEERNVVSWTVLLEGVVRLEGVGSGRVEFDKMKERNEFAWTIMIAAYIENGYTLESSLLVNKMVFYHGLELNHVTLSSFLSACAQSGDVTMGRWIHVYVIKTMGEDMDTMVGTALLNMYAKCGRINTAVKVFDCMPRKNVVTWNAMLGGLAMFGRGKSVLEAFHQMVQSVKPDELTFTSLLSACSHSGLLDQGYLYFHEMENVYGLNPRIEHYACMVDLLGRAGRLEEAEILINSMPMPPNEVVLGSLLGSCSVHRKLQLAERVLQELVQINPHNMEYHILLSNMYVLAGQQEKAESLRQVLKNKGIKKVPGMSYIHVNGQVHQFISGDKSHVKSREIYIKLDEMIQRLKLAGYVPSTTSQVFSIDDGWESAVAMEEKEQILFSHSEKLAVCFGLISTRDGSPLYIFKNLRTCQDCHSAIKIASNVYNRKIVVRDRNRFHSFEQGICSCSDYW